MDPDLQHIVKKIHDCRTRLVLVTAGAGTQALSDLLGVAGATRTLLEAIIPYSEASFNEFLGKRPSQYVADETARLLAGRAFTRARWLDPEERRLVGLACTATIITDRPKLGQHRAHIASWQPSRLICHRIQLHKGVRDRAGEENVVSRILLNALAQSCGIQHQVPVPLTPGDDLRIEVTDFRQLVEQLQRTEITYFGVYDNGQAICDQSPPEILLSGAFNPLHEGHLEMARVAGQLLGKEVAFELAVDNADKPPLETGIALQRISQFAGRYTIFASNASTFAAKAHLYPGTTFIVGYDTAVRILHPRYYGNSIEDLENALEEIRVMECRFLVAGRADDDGIFYQAGDLAVPPQYEELFKHIPSELFRKDISSTELRRTGRKGSR
jgi:nicotinic acid mononucleotide adenylyltransferase